MNTDLTTMIVGNGAIGNLLYVRSHQAGQPCRLLCRQKLSQILEVTCLDGSKHTCAFQSDEPEALSQCDILILPLKAYQILPALDHFSVLLPVHTTLVLLHNGMGTAEQVMQQFPHNPIIAATTTHAAFKPAVNQICITGEGATQAGWLRQSLQPKRIEQHLSSLLAPCHWHQDVFAPMWKKLAINAVINPLTALYQIKNGELSAPKYRAEIEALIAEVSAIMTASGYPGDEQELLASILSVAELTAGNFSSMNRDRFYQRQTEIGYINGYLVKKGQELGLNTRLNAELVQRLSC